MSKVTFDYPHLDKAQEVLECIKKHYNEFDWSWPDADRARNFKAMQRVIIDNELSDEIFDFRIMIVENEDWDKIRSLFTYDNRINSYVDISPDEWIEQWFDFWSPLDVLNLMDDFNERAAEFKTFYQIKEA